MKEKSIKVKEWIVWLNKNNNHMPKIWTDTKINTMKINNSTGKNRKNNYSYTYKVQ